MEQHTPYWHQSSALDAQLAQIIADLTKFLDEHSEGQPYPRDTLRTLRGLRARKASDPATSPQEISSEICESPFIVRTARRSPPYPLGFPQDRL